MNKQTNILDRIEDVRTNISEDYQIHRELMFGQYKISSDHYQSDWDESSDGGWADAS